MDKLLSALGLARRAGRLAMGHDDVKHALRRGDARLIVLASDASPRLAEELRGLAGDTPVYGTRYGMDDFGQQLGRRFAAAAVTERGLAALAEKALSGEEAAKED